MHVAVASLLARHIDDLSILYLRCTVDALLAATKATISAFNSLFEMHAKSARVILSLMESFQFSI